jgi:patatin-like phospholipase/acyl hydrolase
MYTKRRAAIIGGDYDLDMNEVAMATSATPLKFDPYIRTTKRGRYRINELLVDGSLIANNPSLYATVYAKEELKHTNLRTVSLGFIPQSVKQANGRFNTQMNAVKWLEQIEKIIVDSEVTSNDYFTSIVLHDQKYHRIAY